MVSWNSGDFVQVFTAGQYEDTIGGNSTWATGDWNGDQEFDSSDFVAAFSGELGPRQAVPEPSSILLALCGASLLSRTWRRRAI